MEESQVSHGPFDSRCAEASSSQDLAGQLGALPGETTPPVQDQLKGAGKLGGGHGVGGLGGHARGRAAHTPGGLVGLSLGGLDGARNSVRDRKLT